jgi:hypothetical protein
MYPQRRIVRQALMLGLLVTLVVLALSACSARGQEEGAKARPLPEDEKALHPGEYHSVKFKPSLSFRVDNGWANTQPQLPDFIEVGQPGETWAIRFANVKEVFKPGTRKVVEAPKDLVGWFQHHPYLQTEEPEPVKVGGVKGVHFDVLVKDLPQDYYGMCGRGCVDIFSLSNGKQIVLFKEANKRRVIVLEDVKGETVTIDFSSPAANFDEFAPGAQKVIDSVKWIGS